jgi:hypothetical protein
MQSSRVSNDITCNSLPETNFQPLSKAPITHSPVFGSAATIVAPIASPVAPPISTNAMRKADPLPPTQSYKHVLANTLSERAHQKENIAYTQPEKKIPSYGTTTPLATKENEPKSSEKREFGVYPANSSMAEPSKPWQERYGAASVDNITHPKPFSSGGEIPGGLKPWQLSRLRGLEAKGFQFSHQNPESGADHSDSFYHGYTALEMDPSEMKSYSPFLVSGRSKSSDREHKGNLSSARSVQTHTAYDSHGASLPYCDL